jgi:hypothetical protein
MARSVIISRKDREFRTTTLGEFSEIICCMFSKLYGNWPVRVFLWPDGMALWRGERKTENMLFVICKRINMRSCS